MNSKNKIYYTNPRQIPLFEENDDGSLKEFEN